MTPGDERRNLLWLIRHAHPPIAYATLAVSLSSHAVSLAVFLSSGSLASILELRYHVLVLLSLSLVLSVSTFLIDRRSVFLTLVAGRLLVSLVLGVRFPGIAGLRLPLVVALTAELAVYLRFPLNGYLGTAVAGAASAFYLLFDGIRPSSAMESVVGFFIVGIVAWFASYAGRYREELVSVSDHATRLDQIIEELSANNLRLQQLAFRAGEQSKESERNRITREIHDAVGYTLTNLIMMMEAASDIAYDDPDRLTRIIQNARDQAKAGLEDTRRALRELRQPQEQAPHGVQACERLFQTFQAASSLAIHADYGNFPTTFGADVDGVVYRFVQEGLTNAVRHGRSSRVDVVFWRDGRRVSVTITDNGIGAESVEPGIGITGMRERAARFGGSVVPRRVPHGFEVRMELFLPGGDDGENSSAAG